MAMTEERRRQITMALVEQQCIDRGIPGADQLKRDLGNILQKIESRVSGKRLGITLDELMELYLSFLPKVIAIVFDRRRVSLTTVSQGRERIEIESNPEDDRVQNHHDH